MTAPRFGKRMILVLAAMAAAHEALTAAEIGHRADLEAKHAADTLKRLLAIKPDAVIVSDHPDGLQFRLRSGALQVRRVYELTPEGQQWANDVLRGFAVRQAAKGDKKTLGAALIPIPSQP